MSSPSPVDNRTPGTILRDLRISVGMTQPQVAVAANCAIGTISQAERDERIPIELTQDRIARVFHVHRRDIWPDGAR
jgi:transcriptional regulator with XRE-family HTH domain